MDSLSNLMPFVSRFYFFNFLRFLRQLKLGAYRIKHDFPN
jgi:hypothetical protein